MDEHGQVPNLYSGSNASPDLPNDNFTIRWVSGDQQDAMQDMPPPITHSSLTRPGEEGRLDALTRHVNTRSNNVPQYPCSYCKHHQGANGFRRLDHLVQHLKGFHKIDTEDKLPKQRTGGPRAAVASVAGRATVANEDNTGVVSLPQIPPFPCTVIGCIKGGANGYLREMDLLEHQNMMHAFMLQSDMQFYQQDGSSQFHF
ncbi:hypothetical protein F5Y00DRAFT_257088 [Daldinia vernicosa]|uniref:uncharacterized protein n=1 Tax=Daldinia vernicosa TaxID=114800 RepID=UPI0020075BFB|nr:uncharacterized protein F5Y00DRAFT_257088 [Daldinia vernicosa]KAI0853788.1 hypothetical protein F5Y00DRAFT_257088 [Daldinia vernicosa]